MDQRIKGSPVDSLHGVTFNALIADKTVGCHVLPEALAYLRQNFAPQLHASPLRIFTALSGEILLIAIHKFQQAEFEPDGSICIRVADAMNVLPPKA
ncbi:MAG: DUF1488 family protein [Alphaproteobacteria bacterium]|nr:DUF1488 family protein [Alphaproteobacteria bacterium]